MRRHRAALVVSRSGLKRQPRKLVRPALCEPVVSQRSLFPASLWRSCSFQSLTSRSRVPSLEFRLVCLPCARSCCTQLERCHFSLYRSHQSHFWSLPSEVKPFKTKSVCLEEISVRFCSFPAESLVWRKRVRESNAKVCECAKKGEFGENDCFCKFGETVPKLY